MTVAVNWQLPVLPAASVAEHVTVVVPTGNAYGLAGIHVGVSVPSTLSVAVAVKLTAPYADPGLVDTDCAAGQVRTGASVSARQ